MRDEPGTSQLPNTGCGTAPDRASPMGEAKGQRGQSIVGLTSMSSKLSCWLMQRSTFFLLLSCISPASNSSSRMKYAFWKLKMMSSSHTFP